MLAPMPLAASLGAGRTTAPVIAPMGLSLNGNAITVSKALFEEMLAYDRAAALAGGLGSARALKKVVAARRDEGREPLTLGIVFPFSSHNYDLRCWLVSAGIDPDEDVNLIVVPPPLIAQSLASGRLDGFSVGEPWNSVAVHDGVGVIVATKSELWPHSLEKVLGVREAWAERHPKLVSALIRALTAAMAWLADPANAGPASEALARKEYIGVDSAILMRALGGNLDLGQGRTRAIPDVVEFDPRLAARPEPAHAVWFVTQMIRWGQLSGDLDIAAAAAEIYRADLYEAAMSEGPAVSPRDRTAERAPKHSVRRRPLRSQRSRSLPRSLEGVRRARRSLTYISATCLLHCTMSVQINEGHHPTRIGKG